ncbi:hypothetical protein FHL15_004414 [Xylaria flabelliformis]|uniref:BZIP domain-containing protein n=1 Tax=Xylaria flabelliformis TaxID=2512241 RepID=A0A553I364_9PEZI|nr:hypothetical protein FHL15_004414 [Xylaria flabelliformis]
MSAYSGRRGHPVNVSQLLQDLNRVPEPAPQPDDNLPSLDDELAMFTNTNFIDWDAATPRGSTHETSATTSPTTERIPSDAIGGDLSNFDFDLPVCSLLDPEDPFSAVTIPIPTTEWINDALCLAEHRGSPQKTTSYTKMRSSSLSPTVSPQSARIHPTPLQIAVSEAMIGLRANSMLWRNQPDGAISRDLEVIVGKGRDFNGFDFHNYPTPNVNGFSDNLATLAPIQPSPTYPPNGAQGPYGTSMHPGDKIPTDTAPRRRQLSFEEQSRLAAEEDKRRRNTAASARFRVKKKAREQALEKREKELSDKVGALESRISSLETENKWLRELVMEKNGGSDSVVSTLLEKQKPESTRKPASQTKPESS